MCSKNTLPMDNPIPLQVLTLGMIAFFPFGFNECSEVKGYAFPVYSTKACPNSKVGLDKRSSAIKCNTSHSYACLPNEKLTQLLEFCYPQPRIAIQEERCLYLVTKSSLVNDYKCTHFNSGCPTSSYSASEIYKYPSCVTIENGCFIADPNCKRSKETQEEKQGMREIDWIWICLIIELLLIGVNMAHQFKCFRCLSKGNVGNTLGNEETTSMMKEAEKDSSICYQDAALENAIFEEWQREDSSFNENRASLEVENRLKSECLVIVTSIYGNLSIVSANIRHVALKYKNQGWVVKRVVRVEEILQAFTSTSRSSKQTLFIFEDSIKAVSFADLSYYSWIINEDALKICLKKAKLLTSCKIDVLHDGRIGRFLRERKYIDIESFSDYVSVPVDIFLGQNTSYVSYMRSTYANNFRMRNASKESISKDDNANADGNLE